MNDDVKRELIVKTALEVLQNVMPTNVMENLEKFDEDEDEENIVEKSDDFDEDRFFYEFKNYQNQQNQNSTSNTEHIDTNDSLTYFEIVEQEMMLSLPVTRETIGLLKLIVGDFGEISQEFIASVKLQTIDQLINVLVYALMSSESSDETEQTLFLESGTVNRLLETICSIVAKKKDTFIQWPSKHEIERCVRRFERYNEFGQYEFFNVFGAIGTIELQVQPAIPNYLTITTGDNYSTYTPIKWQCSCDVSGFLQSSMVMVAKREIETKNSYVFEANPVKALLEVMKSDEVYLVADETLTLFPYLLTPHEKLLIHAEQHNKALESKRKVIDKTFHIIESRFKILQRIELQDEENIHNLIDTIGILHNFFMVHNDQLYLGE